MLTKIYESPVIFIIALFFTDIYNSKFLLTTFAAKCEVHKFTFHKLLKLKKSGTNQTLIVHVKKIITGLCLPKSCQKFGVNP